MTFDSRWKNPQGSDPKQIHLWAQDLIKELRRGDHLTDIEDRLDALEGVTSGLVLLDSDTVADAAALDIDLTAYTAYRGIRLLLSALIPETDNVELWLRTSTDGGSTFSDGANNYQWTGSASTVGTLVGIGSAGGTEIVLTGNVSSNATLGVNGVVDMLNQTDASQFGLIQFDLAHLNNLGALKRVAGSGCRNATADIDALRVMFSADNIASGKWAVYGYT